MELVRDLMRTDPPTVPVHEAPSSAANVIVVVDRAGCPRWVVGPAGPAPAVLVAPDASLAEIVAAPALRTALADGLPALVVGHADGTLQGVVTHEVLADALATHLSEDGQAVGATLGDPADIQLGGSERSVGGVTILCRVCGQANGFGEFPEPGQLCTGGGHALEYDWV